MRKFFKCMWFFVRAAGFMFVLQFIFCLLVLCLLEGSAALSGARVPVGAWVVSSFAGSEIGAILLYFARRSASENEWFERSHYLGIILMTVIGMFGIPLLAQLPDAEKFDVTWVFLVFALWMVFEAINAMFNKLFAPTDPVINYSEKPVRKAS